MVTFSIARAPGFRAFVLWLIALLLGVGLAQLLPPPPQAEGLAGYVPLHTLLEMVAVAIAVMIFGITWETHPYRSDGRTLVLGVGFLGVALLDIGHTLSYHGMPDFLTPNTVEKAINFWLAARTLAAGVLLFVVFWPARWDARLLRLPRHALLVACVALAIGLSYVFLFHGDRLPATYVAGSGLTPFKVGYEYALIALYVLAGLGWLARSSTGPTPTVWNLALAALAMAMSEYFFTLYALATDVYNLLGHVYKIVAYGFLYRGLFASTIAQPYLALQRSQSELQATISTLPDLLFEMDARGVYLAIHARERHALTAPPSELLGRNLQAVMPPDAAQQCFAAMDEARRTGISRGRRIRLPLPQGPRFFELSVVLKPPSGPPDRREPTFLVLSRDVTETVHNEQRIEREARLNAAILDLRDHVDREQESEFLRRGVEHAERLTGSVIAFVHLVHEDQDTIELVSWSSSTLQNYCTATYDRHYPVSRAGIWAEALRQRRAVVFNDYAQAPERRGLPPGHAPLQRLVSLPVVRGDRVELLMGVGNKPEDYTDADVELLQRLADTLWSLVTQRRQQALILRLSQALEQSPYPVLITDTHGAIQYVNRAFTQVSGYEAAEVIGANPRLFQSGQTPPETYAGLWQTLERGQPWEGEFINRRKDGGIYFEKAAIYPIRDESGQLTHYVAHMEDVSLRREVEQRIRNLSDFDPLTGLMNKKAFEERLHSEVHLARSRGEPLSLLWFNLDNFKVVNESLGHPVGDELLVETAHRLREALGPDTALARYAGDSFVALMPRAPQSAVALSARAALQAVQAPLTVRDNLLSVGASVGIAVFPADADSATALVSAAESAMFRMKQEGRNGLRFFSPDLQANTQRSLELAAALKGAIAANELFLVFQPQMALRDGRLTGAEALLRWQHPKWGAVSPAEFIPLAEQTGSIVPIGRWVQRQALRTVRAWDEAGLPPITLAINVSAVQFAQTELVDELCTMARDAGVPPERIEIELTEAVALRDPVAAGKTLQRLHDAGFRLSIDDFGTGYSSLSYLRDFSVNKLKIDRSFVRDIAHDEMARRLVRTMVDMAHALGMTAIAEGVETDEQRAHLQACGCDEIQGFLYSRPLEADAFVAFARTNARS